MLLTVLRRWSWCCSYSVLLCGLQYTMGCFVFSIALLLFLCFFSHVSIVRSMLGEKGASWSMCFSCVCLFNLHALIFVIFLFLLVSGVAAASDCGTPWIFLLTFLQLCNLSFKSQNISKVTLIFKSTTFVGW